MTILWNRNQSISLQRACRHAQGSVENMSDNIPVASLLHIMVGGQGVCVKFLLSLIIQNDI